MDDKNPSIIKRILAEIDFVLDAVSGMNEADFGADTYAQHAIAMAMLNIGELSNKLDGDYTAQYPDVPWAEMRAIRNIAAHSYDGLDMEIIWKTIHDDLPELKSKLASITAID